MDCSEKLAGFLKLPQPTAKFLCALISGIVFAAGYRLLVVKTPSKIQSLYFTTTGVWMVYFVFGSDIWHSAADIVTVYTLFLLFGPSLATLSLTWIITMGHLLYGYAIVILTNQIHSIFWTMPHCVLVLKLIGLAYNLYDGAQSQEKLNSEQKATCLTSVPSFIDVLGYCYNFGTVLVGPQFSFKRYQDFVSGKLFDWSESHGSLLASLKRICLGLLLGIFYSYINIYFPLNFISSQEYYEHNVIGRIFLVTIIGNLALRRYIVVWLFAEGACIMTGISYNGKKADGSNDWSGVSNVKLLKFETAYSFESIVESFNISTNNWLKSYVLKRLKWMKSHLLSLMVTLLFLCLWHGFWIGYLLSFSIEFIAIMADQQHKLVLSQRFGTSFQKMPWSIYIPLNIGMFFFRHLALSYALLPFMLLSWEACFKFMKSVYFFGHVSLVIWLVLVSVIVKSSKQKSS